MELGKFGELEIELGTTCCHVWNKVVYLLLEVVCNQGNTMVDQDPLSPEVRVLMTEKEALWYEFEHGFS